MHHKQERRNVVLEPNCSAFITCCFLSFKSGPSNRCSRSIGEPGNKSDSIFLVSWEKVQKNKPGGCLVVCGQVTWSRPVRRSLERRH